MSPDDWEVFRAVRLAALKDAPYAFASTYEREIRAGEDDWRRRLAGRCQFVAEVDGEVAGTVGGIASDDGGAALISMWVAPSARGRGVGESLVHAVLDWARGEGHPAVCLWFAEGNVAAERLYLRCGFVRTGVTQPIVPGQPRMEFEMEHAL
ncbi:MAG TPA: GNAT family N-acetyltransferase [Candidatus Baltobacterales bacterium]|nr:GNAT family N-acetyltransferase [Candidatus Baltobacterales bacterium]